jgi:hypothetical protein
LELKEIFSTKKFESLDKLVKEAASKSHLPEDEGYKD